MLTRLRTRAVYLIALVVVLIGGVVASAVVYAASFHTIRINYVYPDGTPAHDAYIATFVAGDSIDLEVTNPTIVGYDPMSAATGGESRSKSVFQDDSFDSDITETVYYVAGLSHYRARFYLQNIYDDLYTTDKTLNAEYQDLLGDTGSFPNYLEEVPVEGFTSLFHEPDAIAADGSTVFRLYYDRNYYSVGFDLGEGGYGVEPIYAKYQTVFRVDTPKRLGYTFRGWARTDIDSNVEGADWHYIDAEGNIITKEQAEANLIQLDGDQVIPAKNTYYKAFWDPGTTNFSVIYWFERPESDLNHTQADFEGLTEKQIQEKIAESYSALAAKDVYKIKDEDTGEMIDVTPGMTITSDTFIRNFAEKARDEGLGDGTGAAEFSITDFFNFNLGYAASGGSAKGRSASDEPEYFTDSDGVIIDFNDMSKGTSEELKGHQKYFELNTAENTPYNYLTTDTSVTVRGDGTTHFNVYFRRKAFTMKFYYARQKKSDGTIDLTNSTKEFTRYDYYDTRNESYLQAVYKGTWQANIAKTKPTLNTKYTDPSSPDYLPYIYERQDDYGSYIYYYYQIDAKYNEPLENKWLIDAVNGVDKKGSDYEGQQCLPGSWAVEYDTKFHYDNIKANGGNDNFTVKGIFERLSDDLMFRNKSTNYTELHYLLSWTNTATSSGWNYSMENILHFTYQNYVELLPNELERMTMDLDGDGEADGAQALIDDGTYTDVIPFKSTTETKYYGLTAARSFETTDSGSQYPINDKKKKKSSVQSDQTATKMQGFELENYQLKGTKVVLDDTNTIIDWSDDSSSYRHCTIKFFYRRRVYTLKYRNGNRKEEEHSREVMYGAPLDSMTADGEYFYYWPDPDYYINELRTHYSFDAWYYTPYYFNAVEWDEVTMPARDLTLYAKWSPKKINVIFYNNYNEYYQHTFDEESDASPIVLGEDENGDPITEWTVNYGSYVPLARIPADTDDEQSNRPTLEPIAEKASFAGWYYIRNRTPHRFEPENVPITALNEESTGDGATLRLFAEWVTQDVAKYKIKYVRDDNDEIEIAPPTTGRAYVWKTKTFSAKSGLELYDEYKWTEEREEAGTNWWPTINSTSIVVEANEEGKEFAPNERVFRYIQKDNVYYRVQYLDAETRLPISPEVEKPSTRAAVKEDAKVIPGYIAQPSSQTLVLSASNALTEAKQREEELNNNVITFLYEKNNTEYIYEAEYYTQDLNSDDYSLNSKEYLTIPIASEGDTVVSVSDLFNRNIPRQIVEGGYQRAASKVEYTYVAADGSESENPIPVADNGTVTIVDTDKKTIRLYFDRRSFPYSYQFIDHTAAKAYEQAGEQEREGMWSGVIGNFPNAGSALLDATVSINAPEDLSYTDPDTGAVTAYTRLTNPDGTLNDVNLTIQAAPDGSSVNLVKVYYRKDVERDLEYRMVCVNSNPETDYDSVTGDPLFGRLNVNRQTVESFAGIQNVRFYDTNNEKITEGNKEVDLHLHKYTFLGWYTSPEYNENDPSENRLTTNETLTKEDLGTNGELPARNVKYYALVKQEMVRMDVDFYFVDDYTKTQLNARTDNEIKSDIQDAIRDGKVLTDGSRGGIKVIFGNPSLYNNHNPIAWHKNDGFSLYMTAMDNRVYKYEFAAWWEIDEAQNNALIPKHDWNNSGEWSADSLSNQLARNKNQHLIAVYTRREVTSMPYTIRFNFKTRNNGYQDFVVKGTLNENELNENHEDVKINSAGAFELTDNFIMENAPYESNFGQILSWSSDNILKSSAKGDPNAENDGDKVDHIITTVNADQSDKKVTANYKLAPGDTFTPINVSVGSNRKTAPELEAIRAEEELDGRYFSYWAIRKSASPSAKIIARSYDPWFDMCIMDNYWITPVYSDDAVDTGKTAVLDVTALSDGDEDWLAWTWDDGDDGVLRRPTSDLVFRGLKDNVIFAEVPAGTTSLGENWSSELTHTETIGVQNGRTFILKSRGGDNNKTIYGDWDNIISLEHLGYSRNRWTDDDGAVASTGETDKLYTDFEVAFADSSERVYGAGSDYRMGLVYERIATIPDNKEFDPNRDYNSTTNYENLKSAIESKADYYYYNGSKGRYILVDDISAAGLTNKNRIQSGVGFANAFTESGGTKTYTNANYLIKVSAYLYNTKDKANEFYFSKPVYICLREISKRDSAAYSTIEDKLIANVEPIG